MTTDGMIGIIKSITNMADVETWLSQKNPLKLNCKPLSMQATLIPSFRDD